MLIYRAYGSAEGSRARSSAKLCRLCRLYNLTTSSYPLLLEYLLYITTLATTPYLLPKCLPIVSFAPVVSSIALLLTLYRTTKELHIRPVNLTGLILFILFILTLFLTLYIREKKGTVLTVTSSGPFAAYKPNYSRYCFHYYFCRRPSSYTARINPAAAAYINSAAAAYINPAATAYGPSYCRAARSWPYYYRPPYYRAARS